MNKLCNKYAKKALGASQIVIQYCKFTQYTRARDLFTHLFHLDRADSLGVSVHVGRSVSPWNEVIQTGVNHAVDQLISNLLLTRFASALPFLEGKTGKQAFLSAAVRSNTQRGCACRFPSRSWRRYQYSIV